MSDVLARIEAYKRREIEAAKEKVPPREMEALARRTPEPRGFAAAAFGWRWAFVGIGAIPIALAAVNEVAWRGIETAAALVNPAGEARIGMLLRVRAVSVTGLWALSVYIFYTYLGTALREKVGFSTAQVAIALIVFGIGATLGSLAGGRLADRFGAGRIASLSLGVLAGAQLLVGALLHAPAGLLIAALAVFSLGAYPCLPAYQSRLVARFGRQSGSVLAWNSCLMYLGTSVGAALGGAVLSRWGFVWITILGALVALAGVVVNNRLRFLTASHGDGSAQRTGTPA